MSRLQLALDAPEHFALLPRVRDRFDLIEVGTPVLKRFGLAAISTALELGGGLPVLADTKTVDGGALEAEMVCAAGASMMTVLAHASPATRADTLAIANAHGAEIVLDTILDGTINQLSLVDGSDGGGTWLALHAPSDMRRAGIQSDDHIRGVAQAQANGFRVSLAGGVCRENLAAVLDAAPEIIVIGSGVTGADDPEGEATWIRSQVDVRAGS